MNKIERKYFKALLSGDPGYDPDNHDREEVKEEDANLISSIALYEYYDRDDRQSFLTTHFPVLDLDFPCELVPSTTLGKFHLYMDKKVTWLAYQNVLTAMAEAGLLEPGYVAASIAAKATFVRKKGVFKVVK
jgi:hypothetical protein